MCSENVGVFLELNLRFQILTAYYERSRRITHAHGEMTVRELLSVAAEIQANLVILPIKVFNVCEKGLSRIWRTKIKKWFSETAFVFLGSKTLKTPFEVEGKWRLVCLVDCEWECPLSSQKMPSKTFKLLYSYSQNRRSLRAWSFRFVLFFFTVYFILCDSQKKCCGWNSLEQTRMYQIQFKA